MLKWCGALSLIWTLLLWSLGSEHATLYTKWADNISNISSSWIFLHEGLNIYGPPVENFTTGQLPPEALSPEWKLDLTSENFFQSKYSRHPLFLVWPYASRPYPPGAFLFQMPFSWMAYSLGWGFLIPALSIAFAFIFSIHLFTFRLFQFLRPLFPQNRPKVFFPFLLFIFFIYFESLQWALQGQYIVLILLPLLLSMERIQRKDLIGALFFVCLAFFIHLHAVVFFPLVLWAAWGLFVNHRSLKGVLQISERSQGLSAILVFVSAVMAALSFYCLFQNLFSYTSGELANSNLWNWKNLNRLTLQQLSLFFIPFLLVLVFLFKQKALGSLFTLLSLIFIFSISGHLGIWYSVSALCLFVTAKESQHPRSTLLTLFVAYVLLTGTYLNNSPFEFYFLTHFFLAPLG